MPSLKKIMHALTICLLAACSFLLFFSSCNNSSAPAQQSIDAMNLKRGAVVLCSPPGKQFGTVEFESSCSPKLKEDFNLAVALLHSFEYDEAEKVFAKIIDAEPGCAMAYWGVAMSNYHPLWSPPTVPELEKGSKAVAIAQSITSKTKKESGYIDAIASFYKDWNTTDHHSRAVRFEKAMEKTYNEFPNDKEVATFYALSLDAAADPTDHSFVNQKKAGAILNALYPGEPDHPGIVHYIIHSYDYPELAVLALPAARKYASIAPASAHAQHMPSHIFTRLGLWDECIQSNLVATGAAKCYADNAGIKGHWDEELHGLDYLMYAYLQKGADDSAKKEYDYFKMITAVSPMNFKVAYAFAAIPARYFLENRDWAAAANMETNLSGLDWQKFPWQKAIINFTRALGDVHIGRLDAAKQELKNLSVIYDTLVKQRDAYKAKEVEIQMKTVEAWIFFKEGNNSGAVKLMILAADMEDQTEKHPVTPGEVLPARELLGDMLLEMNKPAEALAAYEEDLRTHPNRFNGLYGAAMAALKSNNLKKATDLGKQLKTIAPNSSRYAINPFGTD
jgi:tetratricopeptide (TPR) repeat protein